MSFFFFVKNKDSNAIYRRKGNSFDLRADEENNVLNRGVQLTGSDPIVTGSAVFALKYKDGVMMCTDTLGTLQPTRVRL